MGWFLFLGFFFVLVVWAIMIRNKIIRYFNATRRAWADVSNFELQKVKTLNHLEKTLQQYTVFEQSTLEKVTQLRQNIMNLNLHDSDIQQLQQIETLNKELLHLLNVVVENYPELKADQLYSQMMQDIEAQNANVAAAIQIFNRNVEVFNNQIQIFPNNLINTLLLSKKTIRPFSDPILRQNYDYKPNF
ncbi:LemA family protein [Acinetobacter sp. MD2]|uniref:LemA family protein n=1 Tax=Acinetobacter sp. MD2 TaxID=2600066 RepID=UPI002D1EA203|nr:LemA family protein [Acinetobacter sp. MD2]MEB3768363.1 LemA family protein [Acinetobacter sp. MD2]